MRNVRTSFVRLVLSHIKNARIYAPEAVVLPIHVPVKRSWGARDHFYSSKSIRLEVLIFNINNQRGLSRMDGHVFEDQHRAILNKKKQTNLKGSQER